MKKLNILLVVLLALCLCLALAACGAAPEESAEPAAEEAAAEEQSAEGESAEEPAADLVESDLNDLTYVMLDPNVATMDAYNAAAVDGSWTMDVHICDTADQLEQYRGYFEKALASENNEDLESGELELANYTWQYERHVANGQNFGTFFTAIDPPVAMPDNFGDVYGVYCYLWMEDFASMDAMADIIDTLAFREAE